MPSPTTPLADPLKGSHDALRALLDTYARCPTQPTLTELHQALAAYQTDWIRVRAGEEVAPPPPAPVKAAASIKPKFPVGAAERAVLEKLADGWTATTADVPRWVWFEDRELVTLAPNPTGEGPEVLRLAPEGWRAIGRPPA